jgi:hypothetical protein
VAQTFFLSVLSQAAINKDRERKGGTRFVLWFMAAFGRSDKRRRAEASGQPKLVKFEGVAVAGIGAIPLGVRVRMCRCSLSIVTCQ